LVGATILGPRIGRFEKDEATGKIISIPIPGHNLVLAALGGFILWFGFFAFNGGSGKIYVWLKLDVCYFVSGKVSSFAVIQQVTTLLVKVPF